MFSQNPIKFQHIFFRSPFRATDVDEELVKNLENTTTTTDPIETCLWDPTSSSKPPSAVSKVDLLVTSSEFDAGHIETVVTNMKSVLNPQGFVMVHRSTKVQYDVLMPFPPFFIASKTNM